ncbi:odorant receptor 59a-like [Drosophila tropicalis]|uniref:odorant receptor 59a-like n=1 Tax=Drosophila tropicalis TaxID=46794 RepID=UPI0035AB6FC2
MSQSNRVQFWSEMETANINSLIFFRSHWFAWTVLGLTREKVATYRRLYMGYSVLINLLVTIGYPLHLGLALFRSPTQTENVLNLTIFVTCFTCALKFMIYSYNFGKVSEIERLLVKMDMRISESGGQMRVYKQLRRHQRMLLYLFMGIYLPVGMFAELGFIFQKQRALLYPAWFPFDWVNSTRNFYIANVYQIVGISYLLLQNYVNDCFPPVNLCLISAHIKMLYIRFEEIGKGRTQNAELELEACMTDHKRLKELFRLVESFISLPMFIQITVTGINICIGIFAVIFYVREPMYWAYFLFYCLALSLEIFPTCYFGTDNEFWFGRLHYAAFSCDWLPQRLSFKKKMIIFTECSLKHCTAIAGGMLRIHVDTFASTMKFAYSLFTIILRMRRSSQSHQND